MKNDAKKEYSNKDWFFVFMVVGMLIALVTMFITRF